MKHITARVDQGSGGLFTPNNRRKACNTRSAHQFGNPSRAGQIKRTESRVFRIEPQLHRFGVAPNDRN
jgi:hypothetical protein